MITPRPKRRSAACALGTSLLLCGLVAGCARHDRRVAPYFGPTLPMNDLVASINQNNEPLSTVRSEGSFEAAIRDGGKTHRIDGDVTLLYARPQSFRLLGKHPIAGSIFEIASNEDRYWVIARADVDTMWTGTYANINQTDPTRIPIRPDLVMEVLGIQPINSNLLQPPVPAMRFNNDAHAYMMVWNHRMPDRWVAQKEIWYDLKTQLPRLVVLFDVDGRIVLRANLSEHRPVEVEGLPREQWPKMATSYSLFFPETQSKMTLSLDERNLALKQSSPPYAPNERTFIFPADPGVSKVIDLDASPVP